MDCRLGLATTSAEAGNEPALQFGGRGIGVPRAERVHVCGTVNGAEVTLPRIEDIAAEGVGVCSVTECTPYVAAVAAERAPVVFVLGWLRHVFHAPRIALPVAIDGVSLLVNDGAVHCPARVFARVVLGTCAVVRRQAVVVQLDALSAVSGGTRPAHHTTEIFSAFVRGRVAVTPHFNPDKTGHLHALVVTGDAAHGGVVVLGGVPCVTPNSPVVAPHGPRGALLRYLAGEVQDEGDQLRAADAMLTSPNLRVLTKQMRY